MKGRERGMRAVGLTNFGYRRQLQDWLDLSIQKNIPISLLIMSRAFNLTTSTFEAEAILRSSISSLTDDTINEVVLAAASGHEQSSVALKQRKLESLQFQKELIDEEIEHNKEAKTTQIASPDITKVKPLDDTSQLTVKEVEALGDLARGSAVVREKAELAKLQANVEHNENVVADESKIQNKTEHEQLESATTGASM